MRFNDPQQRVRWRIFVALLLIALTLLVLDSTGNLSRILNFIGNPSAAALDFSSLRTDVIEDSLTGPEDMAAARAQINVLELRVDELERANEEFRDIEAENTRLLELFNRSREAPGYDRVAAIVIGQGTNPAFRDIIIDRGSSDGVRVGMPVESARGLVGQVYRTTQNSAQVVFVTDALSSIPGRLSETRATGIVQGGGTGGLMVMDWIPLEAPLSPGEVVLTSGLEGDTIQEQVTDRFPPDIVIGRIVEIERNEAELFQRAIIQPVVDFESLEWVFVITGFDPIDTDVFASDNPDQ